MSKSNLPKEKIAILGLGYVGLPLAIAFGKNFETIGFDKNKKRIDHLKKNYDNNNEIKKFEFIQSKYLNFTSNIKLLSKCNYYVITVPTPIFKNKKPNLSFLISVSKSVGRILKSGDIVIYESTVFPGTTEEICIPILEKNSKLKLNKDFFVGYSPERINPGDKRHTIEKIKKVTSASNKIALKKINFIYKKIIKAGVYPVENIKIAEAAKVIENSQRDLNVAFVNELSIIFKRLKINTNQVLDAASTKWNFINFSPGLVGGHCIGVDPYYLTYKSIKAGYVPKVILSGRKINDEMPQYIVNEVKRLILNKNHSISRVKILILGLTFKENCNDTRNSKVFDIYRLLKKIKISVDVYDPKLNTKLLYGKEKIKLITKIKKNFYNVMIITVGHSEFKKIGSLKLRKMLKTNSIIYDVKSIFKIEEVDGQL
tara:strand:+ start:28163 stop:29446 length:1284 start_codon:yes stop_codon:yes gene_type:complete